MSNIKKTWTGINDVPFRRKKKLNTVIAIKDPICKNKLVKDFSHIPNIADEHFASVGVNTQVRFLLPNNIGCLYTRLLSKT